MSIRDLTPFPHPLSSLLFTTYLYISVPPSTPVAFIMATKTLARWAVNLKTIPTSTLRAALRSLYNYIGCTIGGSGHPTVRKAYTALAPLFIRSTQFQSSRHHL